MVKCLMVIPIFNESDTLESVINKLNLLKTDKVKVDFLYINDGSTDQTENILGKSNVNYLSLINNLGIGGAVQAGYIYAEKRNYDYVVQLDSDGQHLPEEVDKLFQAADECHDDMVIGSRFITDLGYTPSVPRKVGMLFSSTILYLLTKNKVYDTTSGFRLTKKKLIKYFSTDYPQHEAGLVSLLSASTSGFSFKEISVNMISRVSGSSSINFGRAFFYPFKILVNSISTVLIKK